ncbi:hypothetical protein M1349_05410 [Patescibacteria group bacterium]|nr:hypothetical protein [Patescibacteria group bacterium]
MAKLKKKPKKFKKKSSEKVVFSAKPTQKKIKGNELPKNSRFITEKPFLFLAVWLRKLVFPAAYLALLVVLVFVGMDVYQKSQRYFELSYQKENIRQEISGLEKKIQTYPSFKEGYLRLAILEYRLGNINKSRKYIRKAVLLDPNYKQAQDFAKLIGERS